MAFFGRKSPLEALVMPAVFKYRQIRERRREAQSKKVTERELNALHNKIEKLLTKLEESDIEPSSSNEDECIICISSRATMKTMPCGHQVVCRRCFVKTIQSAVAQRLLPLRCVICRARINRLTSSAGTFRLQESASSYSVGKSWSVPGSNSSYSVGAHSYTMGEKVAQSASLYSMSSGSSCASGVSSSSGSATSRASNVSSTSSSVDNRNLHNHNCSLTGCLGAIPRNSFRGHKSHSFRNRIPDLPNRLPPIKEYAVRSPSHSITRHRTPSPVNSGVRFKSYTSPSSSSKAINSSDVVPLLSPINSRSRERDRSRSAVKDELVQQSSATKKLSINNSKVAPIISKATLISKSNLSQAASVKLQPSSSSLGFKPYTVSSALNTSKSSSTTQKIASSTPSKDNKKNDEKLRQKAEKEAKKEEKRLAKEAEKIAKTRAKEMKKQKCSSGENKALLVS